MKKGSAVVFAHKSGPKAGVAVELQGKTSWKIVDERGQNYVVGEKEVLWELPGATLVPGELGEFLGRAATVAGGLDLGEAWDLVQDQRAISWDELKDLLLADGEPESLWALAQVLRDDTLFFKARGAIWEVRTPEQVRQLKQASDAAEARERAWGNFSIRWEAYKGAKLAWDPEDLPRLEALVDLALHGEEAHKRAQAAKVLEALGRKTSPEDALAALIECRWWDRHVQLGVLRRGYVDAFAQDIEDEAQGLVANPPVDPDADIRLDLTGHRVYTIDAASTTEIDDGMSLELVETATGMQTWLWVHIADPGRWVLPGSLVDQEAQRRGTTVYLPQVTIPMMPGVLSSGVASLNPGQISCAFSFGALLADDGALVDYKVMPSLVRSRARLTYQEATELALGSPGAGGTYTVAAEAEGGRGSAAAADGSPGRGSAAAADGAPRGTYTVAAEDAARLAQDLATMLGLARARLRWREAQGAVNLINVEVDLRVKNGEASLDPIEDNAARLIVSECMVLAGEIAGRIGAEQKLHLPYRHQDAPNFDHALLETLPEGLVRDYARRRSMAKGRTSLEPQPHASLGLAAYVQVTSPLRRYNDLAAQRTLKAAIKSQPQTMDVDAWEGLLAGTLPAMADAGRTESECKRYWYLEYLRAHSKETWRVLVLSPLPGDEPLAAIVFLDLGLEWQWKSGRHLRPGETLNVRVKQVDPRLERLVLQEV